MKRPRSIFRGRHKRGRERSIPPGGDCSEPVLRHLPSRGVDECIRKAERDQVTMAARPATLFKYEALSLQSLQNLKNQSIYFASPSRFNDPYDCAITAGVADPTDADIEAARFRYLNHPEATEDVRHLFLSAPPRVLRERLVKILGKTVEEQRERFLTTKGVCCFSEINDDLLMWAHYGGCYRGICLAFDTRFEPFHKIRKVSYVEKMPQIEVRPIVEGDATQVFESLFCTKSRSWAYEREWRCMHAEANKLYTYRPEALKAVYFGPRVDPADMEIVCLILAGQNPGVELWVAKRSETEFKVEFEKKTYTPHIVAKRLGLVQ